uniref:Uncharacterized protein n=1 Tax=Picea glauca TaxID=3330 RepID=A0A117NHW6_PICGL|nr:hypothetical protein ABT39_MTgene4375 [Picea glauca]QHR86523.1 hypothetical protein Q903MT_gene525 [Picea sitchensis]
MIANACLGSPVTARYGTGFLLLVGLLALTATEHRSCFLAFCHLSLHGTEHCSFVRPSLLALHGMEHCS